MAPNARPSIQMVRVLRTPVWSAGRRSLNEWRQPATRCTFFPAPRLNNLGRMKQLFRSLRLAIPAASLATSLMAPRAEAALLAYEPFDYPANVQLIGLKNGFGFSTAWTNAGYDPGLRPFTLKSGALHYPGLATQGTNHISAGPYTGVASVSRRLSAAPGNTNGIFYLSFLHRLDGDSEYASVIFGIGRGEELSIGRRSRQSFFLAHRGGAGRVFSDTKSGEGQIVFVVVKMELQEGPDRITLYVDPTPGQPEPVRGAVKDDLDVQFADTIFLQSRAAWSVDEIRLGTTWAEVTPAAKSPPTN
jgi:hypothetical protein